MKNYTSKKKQKTERTWQCLNCKFLINKRFGWEATRYTHTYIYLFVGNREVLGEFLVLTLNLLADLTPSVVMKAFRKLKTEVVRITYTVQLLSLWQTTQWAKRGKWSLAAPSHNVTWSYVINSVEIDSNRFCSIPWCYPLSVSTFRHVYFEST